MKRNDKILIGIALILAALGYLWVQYIQKNDGARAIVYVDKQEYASYSLQEDGEYEIQTDRGTNHLIIKDGKADMTEADCPDKLCVQEKAVSKNGETIVCLPHRVVVEITSEEENEIDGVTR
jgi:hypothetical protein